MPQIHPISCGLGTAFLVETSHGLFLVDSGSPDQEDPVLKKMNEIGRHDLKVIWITHAHYDHYGSASALRNLTGALIGVHSEDAESMAASRSSLGTTHRYGFIYPPAQKLVNYFHPLPATPLQTLYWMMVIHWNAMALKPWFSIRLVIHLGILA
ncbi:MAG: MBL fold metallo-hydrolase [Anaerolineaceae bacterium]